MSFALTPFGDQIVIRPTPEAETSKGGIILVESTKETPTRGAVISVGPGRVSETTGNRVALSVAVGQEVIYKKYAGTDVKINGEDLKVLRERDILVAVVEVPEPAVV